MAPPSSSFPRPPLLGPHGFSSSRQALSQPVYDEYGGFAGEFEVEGRVVWDVPKGTVIMKGSEAGEDSEVADGSDADWVPFEKGL